MMFMTTCRRWTTFDTASHYLAISSLALLAAACAADASAPLPAGAGAGSVARSGAAGVSGASAAGSGGSSATGGAGSNAASGATPGSESGELGAVGGLAGAPAAALDAGSASGSGGVPAEAGAPLAPRLLWDWAGVIGTGQSLAVGDPGAARNTPETAPRLSTQPFQNLKLSTGNLPWPVDPEDVSLQLLPLTEPIGRLSPSYPSSWPENIAGETAHAAMANQVTALALAAGAPEHVGVHGEVGENGQCLSFLVKNATPQGLNGRAFEASLIETRAITRLARAAGKTYGVGAIIVTHGECDAGNAAYAEQLHQLWADYASDLAAITGQTVPPLMIVSQQSSVGDRSPSALAQWQIGVRYPNDVVASGPKYQYPYSSDAVHMVVEGYEQLGEKYGQVYFERVVMGRAWQPLQPTSVARDGRVVRVEFHVPVPPLVWEESFQRPHQASATEWAAGRGFELRAGGVALAISSVDIAGDAVLITSASELPTAGVTVGYAMTGNPAPMATPFAGTARWGQLRDSDPFVGGSTQKPQPNFALAFELPVP